jgi:hypothetical protein
VILGAVNFGNHWCLVAIFPQLRMIVYLDLKKAAIDTPGGKRNLKMKIKAQQMTFRQDITKI